MAFTFTENLTRYIATEVLNDKVLNRFFRAIPVAPKRGGQVVVNIFDTMTAVEGSCSTPMSDGGQNDQVSLDAYDKVVPICSDPSELETWELAAESRPALADQAGLALLQVAKVQFVTDMVAQFLLGFTNDFELAATNENFGLASAAGASDSMAKLGAAVDLVMSQSGDDPDNMAIVFPVNGTDNNRANLSGQISAWLNNSSAFASRDGYMRYMDVPIFTINSATAGWGGSVAAASGYTQIAAVVLSNKTPGYAFAPIGGTGTVDAGTAGSAIATYGPSYDIAGHKWRFNIAFSFAAGTVREEAIAIVSNP